MSDLTMMRAKCAAWKAANPTDERLLIGWDFATDEPIHLVQEIVATYEYRGGSLRDDMLAWQRNEAYRDHPP